MSTASHNQRLGPIELSPGISRLNVYTKLAAAFISIAMFTGMSFLNAYVLQVNLGIPRSEQGGITGSLLFWTEIVSLLLMIPAGVLADRIGRRPVYVVGIVCIGIGFGFYPFADSYGELLFYRLIYAVGLAACATMLATLTNDYPVETSRGKLIGITSAVNVLGTIFMSSVIAQIPAVLMSVDPVRFDSKMAGIVMFMTAAGLCISMGVLAQLGLKGGTPVEPKDRLSVKVLATSGIRAGRNPRISLSYAGAFAARSDLVIKGAFLTLWAIQDAELYGLTVPQAQARFGLIFGSLSLLSFFCAPLFGWLIDNINRVTATIIALSFAASGYLAMGIITSPLDYAMFPYFIVLSLGSSFMLKASLGLVGQEARIRERASVVAVNGWFGALGILIFAKWGGILFDTVDQSAPFVLAGAFQAFLLIVAILIRVYAPGPKLVEKPPGWWWRPAAVRLGLVPAPSGSGAAPVISATAKPSSELTKP